MVDTARSLTYLQTLFADNTTGDISEQDLRDFLVTSLMQTSTTTAVTTADITGAIGQVYNLDLSGLTAERNLTLPVASAGDMIQVNVTAGDADYELVIKGVATVTINGGSTATEWSRLFIDGESATFRATSATNWQVINDGRIPCFCKITSTPANHPTLISGAWTVITGIDVVASDNANLADTTNSRVNFRRDGLYDFSGSYYGSTITGNHRGIVYLESASVAAGPPWISANSTAMGALWNNKTDIDVSTNSYAYLSVRQDSGSDQNLTSTTATFISIFEVL